MYRLHLKNDNWEIHRTRDTTEGNIPDSYLESDMEIGVYSVNGVILFDY